MIVVRSKRDLPVSVRPQIMTRPNKKFIKALKIRAYLSDHFSKNHKTRVCHKTKDHKFPSFIFMHEFPIQAYGGQ